MSETKPRKVLLIGWDGADWEHINPLLDEGLMPNLEGLINRGVMGNLATLQPVLSPMLWNSIATGKLADKHGILGFMEPDPTRRGSRPFSSLSRKCKAIWNILHHEGRRCNVAGWWASHPAEPINGAVVSNMFNQVRRNPVRVPPGTIHPASRSEELGDLRVEPAEITAEDILPFMPRASEVDQEKDSRIQGFQMILSDCASMQAVTTRMMEGEWDFTAVYFDAIDHFCHGFAEFHPPRRESVPEKQYEIYKDVIRTAYRFHDIMLAGQMMAAGPDALILLCSDHGFHSGALRPERIPREPGGPAVWHRDMGIFVMSGPGIKKDERIYGANIIDITPTLLAAMGLAVGEDMDGRVLTDVFENPPEVRTIPSWEEVEGDCGMHPPGTEIDSAWSEQLTRQFVALGYVDDHGGDNEKAFETAQVECDYNLARVYFSSRRYDEAIPLFEGLIAKQPWDERIIQHLVVALVRAGYARQGLALIEAAYPDGFMPAGLTLTHIFALQAAEGMEAAVAAFDSIPKDLFSIYGLQRELGSALLRLGRIEDAERTLRAAVENNADDYVAMGALARTCLAQRRWEEAADLALESVSRLHQQPMVHFTLGQALMRLHYPEQAARAFEVALTMRPGLYGAHRRLSALYRHELNDPERAARHYHAAMELLAKRREPPAAGEDTRTGQRWPIPELPPPPERNAILRREREAPYERDARAGTSGKTFVIVSGLPRSGTSLMMQMLDAGGLPPQTDHVRAADEDNPRGYWEWEAIKKTSELPRLFEETEGLQERVIKVVSAQLAYLPVEHSYKVVFMMRPLMEVMRSQRKMIERRGTSGATRSEEELLADLREHRQSALGFLNRASNVELLKVSYPALVTNPGTACRRVATFLGDKIPRPEEMTSVIDAELYRQRATGVAESPAPAGPDEAPEE